MKKNYGKTFVLVVSVFTIVILSSGCPGAVEKQPPAPSGETGNISVCKEPRMDVCTREYMPVCANLSNGTVKTFSNACTACSHKNVVSYTTGACSE